MMIYDSRLLQAFRRLHNLNSSDDVRLMENESCEITGVGLYKNDSFCWGATLAELALDIALEAGSEEA